MIQTPVLIIGSVVILVVGLDKVGGWAEMERLNGENMHLMRAATDPDFPWPGILFGSFIIGFLVLVYRPVHCAGACYQPKAFRRHDAARFSPAI